MPLQTDDKNIAPVLERMREKAGGKGGEKASPAIAIHYGKHSWGVRCREEDGERKGEEEREEWACHILWWVIICNPRTTTKTHVVTYYWGRSKVISISLIMVDLTFLIHFWVDATHELATLPLITVSVDNEGSGLIPDSLPNPRCIKEKTIEPSKVTKPKGKSQASADNSMGTDSGQLPQLSFSSA